MLRALCFAAAFAFGSVASAQQFSPGDPLQPAPLPAAPLPTPRIVGERGPSPTYYRLSPRVTLPLFRAGVGMRARFADGDASPVAFTLDVMGGAVFRFDRASRHGIVAEVGYSWAGFSQHVAALGLGVMTGLGAASDSAGDVRVPGLRLAVMTRALAGASYGQWGVGARTGVMVVYEHFALEIAHQALDTNGRFEHEVHLAVSSFALVGELE